MMIIKKFAKLCNCNAQTLRYYDSIGLLKPVKVDEFTGYRYYDADQALDYLKIKNLQDASFSIDEIKVLLTASDEDIFNALEEKVKKQKAKLLEIQKIQKSYRKEMKEMKEKLNDLKKRIMNDSMKLDFKEEFDLTEEELNEILVSVNSVLDKCLLEDTFTYEPVAKEDSKFVLPEGCELIYEVNDFEKISKVLDEMPKTNHKDYFIHMCVEEQYSRNAAFLNVTLYKILKKVGKESRVNLHSDNLSSKFFNILTKYERKLNCNYRFKDCISCKEMLQYT